MSCGRALPAPCTAFQVTRSPTPTLKEVGANAKAFPGPISTRMVWSAIAALAPRTKTERAVKVPASLNSQRCMHSPFPLTGPYSPNLRPGPTPGFIRAAGGVTAYQLAVPDRRRERGLGGRQPGDRDA